MRVDLHVHTTASDGLLDPPALIQAVREAGIAVKVVVGGAPITQEYAREIGAYGYAPDAGSAVDAAMALLQGRN